MFIIKHRPFFFWLTGLILVAAIGSLAFFGLHFSIDFTGGSLVEVSYAAGRPDLAALQSAVTSAGIPDASVRETGDAGITVRAHTLSPEAHNALLVALAVGSSTPTEQRFTSIGPSLGSELAIKAIYAIAAVMLAIVLYIAWTFRKVSRPVPSWGYGLVVIAMLAIDVIVPAGFFAAYAHYTGAEADALFVVALLALLGYCVNDVIVIFDRVRENLKKNQEQNKKQEFETIVGHSIDETIGRSINTSLTVALALLAIIFFGSAATRDFALVMLIGVVIGTFSSIARSAPLLIPIAKAFSKK
jgi:preprotein translocase subunit SecF